MSRSVHACPAGAGRAARAAASRAAGDSRWHLNSPIRALLLLGCPLVAGCAQRAANPEPIPTPADACIVSTADRTTRDTVTIVLETALSPRRAPVPSNEAERLAFRQVYETLLRLDCEGRLRPALAHRWRGDSTGRVWIVELGEHRFADGTPVTAQRVIESWARHGLADRRPWLQRVEARDERTLVVTLAAADPSGPLPLADPALAVGLADAETAWPRATASFRFELALAPAGSAEEYLATPSADEDSYPVLRFRVAAGTDPRDLLSAGADLLVTREPLTLEYAARVAELSVIPLPWDRTYLLVSPIAPPLDTGRDSLAQARFRAALARDAVSVSARGAEPPFAWRTAFACAVGFPGEARPRPRIVYPRGDSTARELAERMVALARVRLALAGLEDDEIAASLRAGADAAFILPFPRHEPASCRDFPALPAGTTVEALIDTRAHLVLRRRTARVSVDADGMPRILPSGSP